MTVSVSITAKLQFNQVDSSITGTTLSNLGGISVIDSFTSGSGDSQVNEVWSSYLAMNTGQIVEYDLTALSKNAFGGSFNISFSGGAIKGFSIQNLSTGINDYLEISFTGANPWTNFLGNTGCVITIGPESPFLLTDRYAGWLVNASNKEFQVRDKNSTAPSYSITLVGITGT